MSTLMEFQDARSDIMGTVESMRKFVGLPATQDLRRECFMRYAPEMDRVRVSVKSDFAISKFLIKVANLEKFLYRWYTGILIGKMILPVQQPKIRKSKLFDIIRGKNSSWRQWLSLLVANNQNLI